MCLSGCAGEGVLAGAMGAGRGRVGSGDRPAAARRLREGPLPGRAAAPLLAARPGTEPLAGSGLAERLGVPCVATGNVHSHARRRARLQDAFVAVRLGMTLEESEPRRRGNPTSALSSPAGDGGALRRAPRGGRRDPAARRAPPLRPERASSATATRGRGSRGVDRELAETCRSLLAERYAGSRAAARGGEAARGRAGDDPRPRPLRLLPPAPRPARAGARGRAGGARAGTRHAPSCLPAAVAAPASARSSAT